MSYYIYKNNHCQPLLESAAHKIAGKYYAENTMKMKSIATMCFLTFSGCGLFGGKGVAKEQINTDIGIKTVKTESGGI